MRTVAVRGGLFPILDALQLVERDFVPVPLVGARCAGGRRYRIAPEVTNVGYGLPGRSSERM